MSAFDNYTSPSSVFLLVKHYRKLFQIIKFKCRLRNLLQSKLHITALQRLHNFHMRPVLHFRIFGLQIIRRLQIFDLDKRLFSICIKDRFFPILHSSQW